MNISNLPLYQGFVSPALCDQLQRFGVTTETPYHYRMIGGIPELNSYAFDHDEYYRTAYANVDAVYRNQVGYLPAYQVSDVMRPLPAFLLGKEENGYVVMCDSIYGLKAQNATRMPDALAMMLLEAIKQRVVKVDAANKAILTPQ